MPKLVLWGSDDVVKELFAFRRTGQKSRDENDPGIGVMFCFEKLMYKMRKDLGHDNKDLSEGMLLSVFINDLDDIVAARRSTLPVVSSKSLSGVSPSDQHT